ERQTLRDGLDAAGFDRTRPAFCTWLGVVPYLTPDAVLASLRDIAGLPAGTRVVFDYANPPADLPPEQRARHEARAARVASIGEPWICYFRTAELTQSLRQLGLTDVED